MVNQKQNPVPTKKSSSIIEKIIVTSFFVSASYSFFSKSVIGWVVTALVAVIYLLYRLTSKKSEDQVSMFEQFKRNRRMNAERKRREQTERESLAREKITKKKLEAQEIEKLKKTRLEKQSKLEKDEGLEKLKEKERPKEREEFKDIEKIDSMTRGKRIGLAGKDLKLDDSMKKKGRVGELELQLEKKLARNLQERGGRTEKEANSFAKNFMKELNLNKVFDSIANTLMVTTGKAVEMVFDVVKEGAEGVINATFPESKVDTKKVDRAREGIIKGAESVAIDKGYTKVKEPQKQNKSSEIEKPSQYQQKRSFLSREGRRGKGGVERHQER
jgi:hypothetical protein